VDYVIHNALHPLLGGSGERTAQTFLKSFDFKPIKKLGRSVNFFILILLSRSGSLGPLFFLKFSGKIPIIILTT
jgi:hypothetical protein